MAQNPAMPHLVLLPGLACDERIWEAQLPALEPLFETRVTDAHMRHDTIEAMAAAVLRENPGPLLLCGASMGGMVAMEAARQAPSASRGSRCWAPTHGPRRPRCTSCAKARSNCSSAASCAT